MFAAGALAVAVAAPWLVTIVIRYGPEAITGAANSRNALLGTTLRSLLFGQFTGATAFDLFLGVGFAGLLIEVGRRRYLTPVWVVAIPIVVIAAGFTYVMVPWSILIAVAVADVLVPAAERLGVGRFGRPILELGLGGAAVLGSLATGFNTLSPMHELLPNDRAAMVWVSQNLPADAKVAVVTGLPWWNDATSEWFPAIARRQSVATPQGYEWTADFVSRQERNRLLQDTCAPRGSDCLRRWIDLFNLRVNFVYVPKGRLAGLASPSDCCPAFRQSIRDALPVVYDGPGATIARVTR
jgi:hypothetical protein